MTKPKIAAATLQLTYDDGSVVTYEAAQDSSITTEPDEVGWGYSFTDERHEVPVWTRWFTIHVGGIIVTREEAS